MILTSDQQQLLLQRYQDTYRTPELGYGTVRDYCDSCDYLPSLSNYQGDLKDFQRPWTVKAVLGTCRPGSKLLEIGAGEPMVAQILVELGYEVTVVDPYDGSAGGPTEFEEFQRMYPAVRIIREPFSAELDLPKRGFDCIYSISVLEHFFGPTLSTAFEGIRKFLKAGGPSLHSIDHVTAGQGAESHRSNLIDILNHQFALGAGGNGEAPVDDLERDLNSDLETYYLSASGHNLWRGKLLYDQFPFRKVVAVLSCVHRNSDGPRWRH